MKEDDISMLYARTKKQRWANLAVVDYSNGAASYSNELNDRYAAKYGGVFIEDNPAHQSRIDRIRDLTTEYNNYSPILLYNSIGDDYINSPEYQFMTSGGFDPYLRVVDNTVIRLEGQDISIEAGSWVPTYYKAQNRLLVNLFDSNVRARLIQFCIQKIEGLDSDGMWFDNAQKPLYNTWIISGGHVDINGEIVSLNSARYNDLRLASLNQFYTEFSLSLYDASFNGDFGDTAKPVTLEYSPSLARDTGSDLLHRIIDWDKSRPQGYINTALPVYRSEYLFQNYTGDEQIMGILAMWFIIQPYVKLMLGGLSYHDLGYTPERAEEWARRHISWMWHLDISATEKNMQFKDLPDGHRIYWRQDGDFLAICIPRKDWTDSGLSASINIDFNFDLGISDVYKIINPDGTTGEAANTFVLKPGTGIVLQKYLSEFSNNPFRLTVEDLTTPDQIILPIEKAIIRDYSGMPQNLVAGDTMTFIIKKLENFPLIPGGKAYVGDMSVVDSEGNPKEIK